MCEFYVYCIFFFFLQGVFVDKYGNLILSTIDILQGVKDIVFTENVLLFLRKYFKKEKYFIFTMALQGLKFEFHVKCFSRNPKGVKVKSITETQNKKLKSKT